MPKRGSWTPFETIQRSARGIAMALALHAGSVLGADLTVNSLADNTTGGDGMVTLREAILAANSASNVVTDLGDTSTGGGADAIVFDASLTGGTITLTQGQLTITDDLTIAGLGATVLTISGNNASRVFQVNASGATVDIAGLAVTGGSVGASQSGGGVLVQAGALTLQDSTISGNTADFGGGIEVFSGGTATIRSCTITGNSASYGAGVELFGGTATFVNCTISGNSSTTNGGAVEVIGGNGTFRNSTITDNSAANRGGGFRHASGTTALQNTIVAGNTAGSEPDVSGSVSATNSLIGINNGSNLAAAPVGSPDVNGNLVGTSTNPIDPLLGPLQDNGGPTQTHALLAGSPAIDSGDNAIATGLTFDQRGFLRRINGTVDIGAFEYDSGAIPSVLVVDNAVDENDGDFDSGDLSLREALYLANVNIDANTITFDPALTAGGDATLYLDYPGDYTAGPSALGVTSDVTISGPTGSNGITIARDGAAADMRLFFVGSGASLSLSNVTLSGGRAVGGDGGNGALNDGGGGGGAAGLGGAVFNAGTLNLIQSTLSGNSARGGDGGNGSPGGVGDDGGGGGGGGLGGHGGNGAQSGAFAGGEGGGGGGGVFGNGGSALTETGDGGGGGGGDQADGADTSSGTGGAGGTANGGTGGSTTGTGSGADGGPGGGGGGGAKQGGTGFNGGNGGFGGGGGGSGEHDAPGSTNAGNGGFGGGGGGGGEDGSGGTGGFGGGGGGGSDDPTAPVETSGMGGFGAGDGGPLTAGGSISAGGGGGAGLGGGIFNDGGTVTITNSTISGNSAIAGSGGGGTTSAQDGSDGQGLGGGIFNLNGSVTVSNSTIANNTAADGGGGIFNLAHETAGYITPNPATVTLVNSIVADSAGGVSDLLVRQNGGDAAASTADATDPNIVESYAVLGGTLNGAGILPFPSDPVLGPIQDNGGPTFTHLPLFPSSPAIDASTTGETVDQRGLARPQGANFDLGAVEAIAIDPNDWDVDGIPNDQDLDDDGDGVKDDRDPDRDGDGVNNDLDTDPDNPFDAGPYGMLGVPGLSVKKVQVKLDFDEPGKDKITAKGTFPIPLGFVSSGATVDVDVGGQTQTFTLDDRGRATSGEDKFKLRVSRRIGTDGTFNGRWVLTLKKGTFAVNDAAGAPFDGSTPGIADRVLKMTLSVSGGNPDLRYNVGTVVYKSTDVKGNAKTKRLKR